MMPYRYPIYSCIYDWNLRPWPQIPEVHKLAGNCASTSWLCRVTALLFKHATKASLCCWLCLITRKQETIWKTGGMWTCARAFCIRLCLLPATVTCPAPRLIQKKHKALDYGFLKIFTWKATYQENNQPIHPKAAQS